MTSLLVVLDGKGIVGGTRSVVVVVWWEIVGGVGDVTEDEEEGQSVF